jgi:O-antigen/teichoic acid export membrane protein
LDQDRVEIYLNSRWFAYLPPFIRVRLEGRLIFQKTISNTGWLFFDKIVRLGVGLFVGAWVARYLGPDQYGLLSYVIAFVSLFSAMATLGLDGIVVRNIVRDPASKEEILGTAFVLKLIGGIAALLLSTGSLIILRPSGSLVHWLVGITAAGMIFQALDPIDFWFQSQIQSKYVVYARTTAFSLIAVIKIALILTAAPLMAFACAGMAEIALASIGLMIVYQSKGNNIKAWRANLACGKSLLRDSWPLILSGIMVSIYGRIDQVMIGNMVGNAEVGIYSAAVRLAEAWYFIPLAVAGSVFPSIVEAKAISEELFYGRLQKLYNLMALMAYIVAIPVTLMAGWLVTILFGAAYARAGPMLAGLIWAGLFVNLGVARSSFLTTMNWTRIHFMTVSLGCIINVALNYLLIPLYGGMGAVVASCVAYWFAAHGACFVYKPLYKTGYMLTRAIVYPKVW